MATGKMYSCEVKRRRVVDGEERRDWFTKEVGTLQDGELIRCLHCHGKVRIHRQRVEHGPQDHVEHLSSDDANHCRGGAAFHGTEADHRMSPTPVL